MLIRHLKLLLPLLFSFCLSQGCSSLPVKPTETERYITDGLHYTFAVYNSDNLLITHPYEAWKNAYRVAKENKKPYTDLYIISHGWNFTHQESLSNYYRYIQTADKYLPIPYTPRSSPPFNDPKSPKVCPEDRINVEGECTFKPYFIFVVWNSTSRPLSESAYSILPFGLEDTLSELFRIIDLLGFHIISNWKQSINASRIATGRGWDKERFNLNQKQDSLEKDSKETNDNNHYEQYRKSLGPLQGKYYFYNCVPYKKPNNPFFSKEHLAGREIPLAALIAQIIKPQKQKLIEEKIYEHLKDMEIEVSLKEDELEKEKQNKQNPIIKNLKNFGLELINLGSYQTNRERLEYSKEKKEKRKNFYEISKTPEFQMGLNQCQDTPVPYNPDDLKIHLVGHSYGAKLISLAGVKSLDLIQTRKRQDELRQARYTNQIKPDISSLTVFNAAFSPIELYLETNPYYPLATIPRKATIFTNSDYATGLLFDTSQKLLNATVAQAYDKIIFDAFKAIEEKDNFHIPSLILEPIKFGQGGYALGAAIASSPIVWAYEKRILLKKDFLHHFDTHSENVAQKFWRSIHFILPVEKAYPLNYFQFTSSDSDQYGLWRSTEDAALGRSGLHNLMKGRKGILFANIFLQDNSNIHTGLEAFIKNQSRTEAITVNNSNTFFSRFSCFQETLTEDLLLSQEESERIAHELQNQLKDTQEQIDLTRNQIQYKDDFYSPKDTIELDKELSKLIQQKKVLIRKIEDHQFNLKINSLDKAINPALEDLEQFYQPHQFFSVNASSIYNTNLVPLIGAHGDLREKTTAKSCQRFYRLLKPDSKLKEKILAQYPNIDENKEEDNIENRHATFNFVLKFTQGKLVQISNDSDQP